MGGWSVRLKAANTKPETPAGSAAVVPSASARISRVPAQQAARDVLVNNFRMPGTPDPAVRLRRLAGLSTWAALLGFGGLFVVGRIMVGLFTEIATWYLLVALLLGLVGVACTVAAFASVHQRRLPWLLLGTATVLELACILL
jgi:hypothetical protein